MNIYQIISAEQQPPRQTHIKTDIRAKFRRFIFSAPPDSNQMILSFRITAPYTLIEVPDKSSVSRIFPGRIHIADSQYIHAYLCSISKTGVSLFPGFYG